MLRRYLEAVSGFAPELVEAAVSICMAGELPGYDGRFAPTPPQFATACRVASKRKADRDYANGGWRPRLPPPPIEHTPASRARVRDMVKQFTSGQVEDTAAHDEADARRLDILARTNAIFSPDTSDDALAHRLLGYSVGSPESEENAT